MAFNPVAPVMPIYPSGNTLASPVTPQLPIGVGQPIVNPGLPGVVKLQHPLAPTAAPMPVGAPPSQNPNLRPLMSIMAHLGAQANGMPPPDPQRFMTNHPQFAARHPQFAQWPGAR